MKIPVNLRNLFVLVPVLAVSVLASCADSEESPPAESVAEANAPTPTAVITASGGAINVVIHLSPTDGEGQIGTATFNSESDITTVNVSIDPSSNEAQPIHIHSGICTEVGPVLHALENVVKGNSVSVIELSLEEILKNGALVNVHESYSNASNYTACGQLPDDLP